METMKGLAEKALELGVKFNMKEDLKEIKQERLRVSPLTFLHFIQMTRIQLEEQDQKSLLHSRLFEGG